MLTRRPSIGRSHWLALFRIVLHVYFDADLPILPDRVWLSPDYARIYDFVECRRE